MGLEFVISRHLSDPPIFIVLCREHGGEWMCPCYLEGVSDRDMEDFTLGELIFIPLVVDAPFGTEVVELPLVICNRDGTDARWFATLVQLTYLPLGPAKRRRPEDGEDDGEEDGDNDDGECQPPPRKRARTAFSPIHNVGQGTGPESSSNASSSIFAGNSILPSPPSSPHAGLSTPALPTTSDALEAGEISSEQALAAEEEGAEAVGAGAQTQAEAQTQAGGDNGMVCPFDGCARLLYRGNPNGATTHLMAHYESAQRVCQVAGCGETGVTAQVISRHFVSKHLKAKTPCRFCGRSYSRQDAALRHQRICRQRH
ncbi:hypothetical protein BD310DRAFT_937460 [Dichomitus squalens]|uniref:C2H2-type domain-containing protein n=1 Tax=Dichomitus squalens TaxID=114155 RepID=A0A4Q9PFK4_9APHY|nr:hypothetical protein BD310DRAFT_937460 [Dichomitus squalens]